MKQYAIETVANPAENMFLPGFYTGEIYSVEKELLVKYLMATLKMAGNSLGRPNGYGGPYPAGSQFGFTQIRPFHLGGTGYSWRLSVSSEGWFNPTTFHNLTVPKDTWILMIGLNDSEPSPILDSIKMSISTTNLPVLTIEDMKYDKYHNWFFPQPLIITPQTTIEFEAHANATGYTSLKPIGYAVTTGVNLSKKSYYT